MRKLLALAFLAALPAASQVTCSISAVPLIARANGASELVGDLILTCVSDPTAFVNTFINLQIFLNTNITSRIMNPVTSDTEGLLLIDEPQPGVANTSNTFPYFGQVLGTPGVPAGVAGSGNVYQAKLAFGAGGVVLNNSLVWAGIPFVGGSTRTLRITNIRANATLLGGGAIMSFVSIGSSASFSITGQPTNVGQPLDGLTFTSSTAKGLISLHFQEQFAAAFKKRIENTLLGPLTASFQDVPGTSYCTESDFTPEFTTLVPGDIGSASTGTRLVAHFAGLPHAVTFLVVPNAVTSPSGELVAHRVLPPFASDFTGGTVLTGGGSSIVVVNPVTHTADLLYEVTAASPFLGKHGCFVIENFDVSATTPFHGSLGGVAVTGHLAPIDGTGVASSTAPEPRFVP